jgi:polyhydroxyalkanoate synthesis regulator phasin
MPINLKRHRNQKGITNMATQLATVELRLVPTAQTQKEIENTIDAPRRLAEAIEEFKRKRANAEAELAQSLAKDLAAGPLNVESAIEKHKAFKARDDLLASKINTAEELRPIIEELIEELKRSQPDALKAVLRRKLEQLEKEAAAEQDKAELLKEQIESLKALLEEIDKPAAAAKRKKE